MMETTNIPVDAPTFVLAKEAAKNASDVNYFHNTNNIY